MPDNSEENENESILTTNQLLLPAMPYTFSFLLVLTLPILILASKHVNKDSELKVLVLADFHYDSLYKANGTLESHCRDSSETQNSLEGLYGRYGCDTPFMLLSTMIRKVANMNIKPDLIIALGDFPAHFAPSVESQEKMMEVVVDELREAFPNQLILPVIGNNDTFPNYCMPQTFNSEDLKRITYHFNPLLLTQGEEIANSLSYSGYYEYTRGNTSFIVLNTLLYSRNWKRVFLRKGIPLEEILEVDDPLAQWTWLENTLEKHKKEGTKAILIGHIPPGVNDYDGRDSWTDAATSRFLRLVSEYHDSIGGMLFGHFHQNKLKLVKVESVNDILFGMTVPGISLGSDTDPGFTVMNIKNGILKDYTIYHAEIPKINNKFKELEIKKLYTFSELYGDEINTDTLTFILNKAKNSNDKLDSIFPGLKMIKNKSNDKDLICALIIRNKDDYDQCLKKL